MRQPKTNSNDVRILTIGHSNVSADKIIALLKEHKIETLVDVRSVPYSKYVPEFNRESFSKALEPAGIEYVFAGDSLGGRPKDPACYRIQPDRKGQGTVQIVDYDELSRRPWFLKGIARLINMAGKHRTVIMCSEENPYKCHRHKLIAQTLLEEHAQVLHIRAHGGLESAKSHTEIERQMTFLSRSFLF